MLPSAPRQRRKTFAGAAKAYVAQGRIKTQSGRILQAKDIPKNSSRENDLMQKVIIVLGHCYLPSPILTGIRTKASRKCFDAPRNRALSYRVESVGCTVQPSPDGRSGANSERKAEVRRAGDKEFEAHVEQLTAADVEWRAGRPSPAAAAEMRGNGGAGLHAHGHAQTAGASSSHCVSVVFEVM